jgi:hypothetical protein
MACRELLPEALTLASRRVVWLVSGASFGAMAVFQALML